VERGRGPELRDDEDSPADESGREKRRVPDEPAVADIEPAGDAADDAEGHAGGLSEDAHVSSFFSSFSGVVLRTADGPFGVLYIIA
jgi:hypothetical protein